MKQLTFALINPFQLTVQGPQSGLFAPKPAEAPAAPACAHMGPCQYQDNIAGGQDLCCCACGAVVLTVKAVRP